MVYIGTMRRRGLRGFIRLIEACNSGEHSAAKIAMCVSKVKYDSEEAVMRNGRVHRAYLCPHCEHWHGTNLRKRRS
jgi:hypothetical protein